MSARRVFAAALAAAVLFAGTTVLLTRVLEPEPIRLPTAPLTRATAPPDAPRSPEFATSPECSEMDNPGGLEWKSRPDAGPFPTDGTVALPSLGVSAPIVRVGVGLDGTMVVPKNARDVAWLDQGPIPGKTKNIVLAGHISYSRVAGSFFRLREVQKGDEITVAMDGKDLRFKVVWNCYFDRNTDRAAQIMGRTDVPSVTLISCGGVFDRAAGTHTQRVAVRAEAVET